MGANKSIEVICENPQCGKSFTKSVSHYNENIKKKIAHTCSHRCAAALSAGKRRKNTQEEIDLLIERNKLRIRPKDVIGVRYLLRMCSNRGKGCDLDDSYLLRLWEEQNVCPYSGVKLSMPRPSYPGKRTSNNPLSTASIDRIDSSKGYVQGNVQYVAMFINWMKGPMSHEQTIEACKAIAKAWSSL
jgi:hypothetical protein